MPFQSETNEHLPDDVTALFSTLDDETMADLVQRLTAARDTDNVMVRASLAAGVANDILKRVTIIKNAKLTPPGNDEDCPPP